MKDVKAYRLMKVHAKLRQSMHGKTVLQSAVICHYRCLPFLINSTFYNDETFLPYSFK